MFPKYFAMWELQTHVSETLPTKRSVLSRMAQYYDPLGLTNGVLVSSKIFMRKLWENKLEWDAPLTGDLAKEWTAISKDLSRLPELKFDRKVFQTDNENSLLVFCDASTKAYGFVAYAKNSETERNLLLSKVKVAPLKTKSLPTLELMSIFLALTCLLNFLEEKIL